jgi:conjugative relaxase-like TrwC/TraI family protein
MVGSLNTGHSTDYMTKEVQREDYYSKAVAAGEPSGKWYGAGAHDLGLTGEVDPQLMEAIYEQSLDPRNPHTHDRSMWGKSDHLGGPHREYRDKDALYQSYLAKEDPDVTPERRAELYAKAGRNARQAVAFIDATFSVQKSVSVLGVACERAASEARAAGRHEEADQWEQRARHVEEGAMVGSRTFVDYLAQHAGYSRIGKHGAGEGQWVDANRWTIAQFLQHDSRDHDPQLHVHAAILNRVECPDGQWRTLDSRAIHEARGAASAVAERAMEAYLTEQLGIAFEIRPDGKAREVVGVPPELCDAMSSRRRAITGRLEETIAAFTAKYGRPPKPAELNKMAQDATLSTRKAKVHDGETLEQRLERWEQEARKTVGEGLAAVAAKVQAAQAEPRPREAFSATDVIAQAVDAVREKKVGGPAQT